MGYDFYLFHLYLTRKSLEIEISYMGDLAKTAQQSQSQFKQK